MPDIVAFSHTSTHPAAEKPSGAASSTQLFASKHTQKNVSFQKQDADEGILLILRRHGITNISWILTGVFLMGVPILGSILLPFLPFSIDIPSRFIVVTLIAYYIMVGLYLVTNVVSWLYNVFIITEKRIVDIDFSDVIYHDVAITKIEEVEDVHYTQSGFLSTIFNYGHLHIQTQADKANFEAESIPNPSHAANVIVELTGKGGHDD